MRDAPSSAPPPPGNAPGAPPTLAGQRRHWPWLLLALGIVLLGMALLFDANWLRGPIERRVESATGRSFQIAGELDLEPGWPPTLVLHDLELGNADWSDHETMARAARMELDIAPFPLLLGRLVLHRLVLDRPYLLLERAADDSANWHFGEDDDGGQGIAIGYLRVDDGQVRVLEHGLDTALTVNVQSRQREDGSAAVRLGGDGQYRGRPFSLRGSVDSPLELRNGDERYAIDLEARAGSTVARVQGELDIPIDPSAFAVRFALSGADMEHLYPLLGITMPATPPYTLDGRLSRHGQVWRYREFEGTIGDSDLSGVATLDLRGERPLLKAKLVARQLDFDDLGASIGAAPGTGEGETASEAQQRLAAQRAAEGLLLPNREFRAERLRSMDADVSLDAAEVESPRVPVDALSVRIRLEDGVLRLDPLTMAAGGGRIAGSVRMDARGDPIATTMSLAARGLELPKLFPRSELVGNSTGDIAGELELSGDGNSFAAMLGNADGDVGLAMGRGQISNLLLELAGLDLAEALGLIIGEDKPVTVHCAFAQFDVAGGVMTATALALDTADTVILGGGRIDLAEERLDLELQPRPRDRSLVALRVPLQVGGTLRDPDVSPQGGPLALRALAGAALYALAPPAALLALVETGPGEDTGCSDDTRERTAQADEEA